MREMYDIETGSTTNGVGLLVSILLRYPEVSTVKYDPEENILDFSFMIKEVVDVDSFNKFERDYSLSLHAFWNLIKMNDKTVLKFSYDILDSLTRIVIRRDIATLTSEEITLSMALLQNAFDDFLIKDRSSDLLEEDMLMHEEMIRNLLADVNESSLEKKLIGYRDEGRVVVFNRTAGSN